MVDMVNNMDMVDNVNMVDSVDMVNIKKNFWLLEVAIRPVRHCRNGGNHGYGGQYYHGGQHRQRHCGQHGQGDHVEPQR